MISSSQTLAKLYALLLADPTHLRMGFHGTDQRFRHFVSASSDRTPSSVGPWFSSDLETARRFAQTKSALAPGHEAVIVAALICLETPRIYETYSEFTEDWIAKGRRSSLFRRDLRRSGYDGVAIESSNEFAPLSVDQVERGLWVEDPSALASLSSFQRAPA